MGGFSKFSAAVILLGFWCGGLAFSAWGAEETGKATVGPVTGTIVDSAGKPAAGATVWLLKSRFFLDPEVIGRSVADAQGRFRFDKFPWARSSIYESPPLLTAQDAQGRLGCLENRMESWFNNTMPENCRITLIDGKDYRGRLIDSTGKPIARTVVTPILWTDGPPRSKYFLILPAVLGKKLAAETDADGWFTLRNFMASGQMIAQIGTGEFGHPIARWKLEKPVTISLGRPGNLQVEVTCAQNTRAAVGLKFVLGGNLRSEPSDKVDFTIHYFQECLTQNDGKIQFEKIPPVEYMLLPELIAAFPYYAEGIKPVEVRSGKTARLSLELKPAVKVHGKVTDQETEKGIAGCWVMFFCPDGANRQAVTDSQGMFSCYAKPGWANTLVWGFPDVYINPEVISPVNVTEETTLPPISLERWITVEGLVVDASGQPVADAEVRYAEQIWGATWKILRSDAAGKFTLQKFSPRQHLAIRARTKNLATEPQVVELGKLTGPIRLVVSEKTTFTVRGSVADEAGHPLPQAKVTLTAEQWGYPRIADSSHERRTSDAEGKFLFGGLWPGDTYSLFIQIPGRERYGSARIKAIGGAVHDLGTIVLHPATAVVEGRVLDSSGRPIAGAAVFNSGDGPEPMETLSDGGGRFRLEGFRKGPVYVFAVKEGYRFAGLRTATGSADAELKLLRSDEPAPERPIKSPSISHEEQKKLARVLLEKLWDSAAQENKQSDEQPAAIPTEPLPGLPTEPVQTEKPDLRRQIQAVMARLDPALAEKWSKELKTPLQKGAEQSIEQIADADLEEALSLINEKRGNAEESLMVLTRHFAPSDRQKALRCAEEVIVCIRSLDQPARAMRLAEMGSWIADLGNKEAGKELVDEAAEMVSRWAASSRTEEALQSIIPNVASCDVSRAEGLLEKVADDAVRNRLRVDIAVAAGDAEKLESLVKGQDTDEAQYARLNLANRIAKDRPAEAVRLVENLSPRFADEERKVGYFSEFAQLIGLNDPPRASALIDRVFAVYLPPSHRPANTNGERTAQAAQLAVLARKVGYPDMENMIHRVLALRPTPGKDESPIPAMESTVRTAMILALVDPETARQILQTIEPNSPSLNDREDWLKAWALADPPHAMELAERELAETRDPTTKAGLQQAVLNMAELWVIPPDERIEHLNRRDYSGVLGLPDFEFESVTVPD